jgi:hypothetical protein
MLAGAFGQFMGGVLWGVGATLASSMMRGQGNSEGLRDITKLAVKTYLTAADRVQEAANDLRGGFEMVVAEAEAERKSQPPQPSSY